MTTVEPHKAALLAVLCNAQDERRPIRIDLTNGNAMTRAYVHGFNDGGDTVRLGSRHDVDARLQIDRIRRVRAYVGGGDLATVWESDDDTAVVEHGYHDEHHDGCELCERSR